jgi:hypothetical protein
LAVLPINSFAGLIDEFGDRVAPLPGAEALDQQGRVAAGVPCGAGNSGDDVVVVVEDLCSGLEVGVCGQLLPLLDGVESRCGIETTPMLWT